MERWDPENRTHDRFVIDRVTASSNMLTLKDREGGRLDLKVSAVDSQWTLFRQIHCRWQRGNVWRCLGRYRTHA